MLYSRFRVLWDEPVLFYSDYSAHWSYSFNVCFIQFSESKPLICSGESTFKSLKNKINSFIYRIKFTHIYHFIIVGDITVK